MMQCPRLIRSLARAGVGGAFSLLAGSSLPRRPSIEASLNTKEIKIQASFFGIDIANV